MRSKNQRFIIEWGGEVATGDLHHRAFQNDDGTVYIEYKSRESGQWVELTRTLMFREALCTLLENLATRDLPEPLEHRVLRKVREKWGDLEEEQPSDVSDQG